jgi:hypothetical protein
MFSIPFALVGVILGLRVSGTALGVMSMIGIIILLGIVVKNGIVLIDYTILLRERGIGVDATLRPAGTRLLAVERVGQHRGAVAVDAGKKLENGTWGYNEQSRTVTVYVPATPCEQRIKVEMLNN